MIDIEVPIVYIDIKGPRSLLLDLDSLLAGFVVMASVIHSDSKFIQILALREHNKSNDNKEDDKEKKNEH